MNSEYFRQLADIAELFAEERGQQAEEFQNDLRALDTDLEREMVAVNDSIVKPGQDAPRGTPPGWNQLCSLAQDKLAAAEALRRSLPLL